MELESHRPKGQLPVELGQERVVQVGVHVGQEPQARRVRRRDREEVLDRLDPGRQRAVLAEHDRHVDALGRQIGVERRGDDGAVGVVEAVHRIEARGPLLDRHLQPGQAGGMEMGVDEGDAVDHSRPRST
ncbi:MAG: hypothetical protein ACRDYF_13345 [Acidimicrobiia bacterium]